MKQFYELYKDNEKVSTLLTQLNWSNHLKIMSACKTMEERIFYMSMCVKEKYSARELARQIDSGYYERYMLSQHPIAPAIEEAKKAANADFAVVAMSGNFVQRGDFAVLDKYARAETAVRGGADLVLELPLAAAYGSLAVAAAQLGYFQAISSLPVAVANMLPGLFLVMPLSHLWSTYVA